MQPAQKNAQYFSALSLNDYRLNPHGLQSLQNYVVRAYLLLTKCWAEERLNNCKIFVNLPTDQLSD